MMKYVGLVLVLVLAGCTSSDAELRRVLEDDGFADIENLGYGFFGCSDDDVLQTRFRARRGTRVVEGVVCCGLLMKDCTVRY